MYIGVILVMVFYIFGILAMIMYKANDPWHFANVHLALLSLFRAATLEDWSDIMYVNFYGCANYGAYGTCATASQNFRTLASRAVAGSEEQQLAWHNANITAYCGEAVELGYTPECCCEEHSGSGGVFAVVFFIFFTVLGALVLMTLFME